MSGVFFGMGIREMERRERAGPEGVMQVFGVQEWFRRERWVERVRPRGVRVGVVRVRVLIRIFVWRKGVALVCWIV